MSDQLHRMCQTVERHCKSDRMATPVEGLVLYRMSTSAHPAHIVYNPRICMILRGSKTVNLAQVPFDANISTFLFVTVAVPVSSMVYRSPDGQTHIGLALDLDPARAAAVLERLPHAGPPSTTATAVMPAKMNPALLDTLERLLNLLDDTEEASFMAPLLLDELYYRLVLAGLGPALSQYAVVDSNLSQIGKAIAWIREHYRDPMQVADLAAMVGMSLTSFHRRFKSATLMTPVQYRAEIRLQEARRLMMSTGAQAGLAGSSVGYDSQSQFSREYKRRYGRPPALDMARLQPSAASALA